MITEERCDKCGKVDMIIYRYRGTNYCHSCLRSIAEVVREADDKYPRPLKDDDFLFLPGVDEETRAAVMDWSMANVFIQIQRPELAYAWLKCHFNHPDLTDQFRKAQGEPPLTKEERARFSLKELREWDKATQEYLGWDLARDTTKEEEVIPQNEQWVIIQKLENGEIAVASKRGYIDVSTYEQAKEFLSLKLEPGLTGYSPDGSLYGTADIIGNDIVRVVERQAVPRTDYDPQKHDTFRLRLGQGRIKEVHKATTDELRAMNLLVDVENPGSAFDVMDNLYRQCERVGDHEFKKKFREAHPIVWTHDMTVTAFQAASQLQESLNVERDLLLMDPELWLFNVATYENCPAVHAVSPVTIDGHAPFPDELVPDLGAPVIAQLFYLTDTEIRARYLYLLFEEPPKINIYGSDLRFGSQPGKYEDQVTLKILRFTTSPYLVVRRYGVERHTRRRTEDRFPHVSEGVGVILLRRIERIYEKQSPGISAFGVDWSCQWWVSGHWRRQWYASQQTHKPVWIAPYIKGPADKPLKEAVRLIIR